MKHVNLTPDMYDYLAECRTGAGDPVLADLRRQTLTLGDDAEMQISPEQGSFLTILTRAVGARRALEIGTFTGYSSICIARGLVDGGRLTCLDENRDWIEIARSYWRRANVDHLIEIELGPALVTLGKLPDDPPWDFVFVDADKTEYDAYYELVLPRMRRGGLILFDNMLWGGRLMDRPLDHPSGQAIDALNHKLASDTRVQCVLLPIADGIQICQKI